MKPDFKKTRAAFFFILCVFTFYNGIHLKGQNTQWVKQMGGSDSDIGSAITSDALGNVYTVGTFSGTATFGSTVISSQGKGDTFITKTNASDGNMLWVKQIGSSNEDNASSVICDASGNVYYTGKFSGVITVGTFTLVSSGGFDTFIIKLDPTNGSVVWAKRVGGAGYDSGLSITVDINGNIYTTGCFQGISTFGTFTINPTSTSTTIFITKMDAANGNVIWVKSFGSSGYDYGTGITCDTAGDIYLTGYFETSIVFGSDTLIAQKYTDIFISKHNGSTGNTVWAKSMGGDGNDLGAAIICNSDGNIYATGKFEQSAIFGTNTLTSAGNADVFMTKMDPVNGSLIWVKQLGGNAYDQANSMTHDAFGNIYTTGQFIGQVFFGSEPLYSSGNADVFIARTNSQSGDITWAARMGGNFADSGYGISCNSDGALYCTGSFQSTLSVEGSSLSTKGAADIFIVKLDSKTVSIQEQNIGQNSIEVFPNPFDNEINVFTNGLEIKDQTIVIMDMTGKIILKLKNDRSKLSLNLSELSPGIYFLTATGKNGNRAAAKIIKN